MQYRGRVHESKWSLKGRENGVANVVRGVYVVVIEVVVLKEAGDYM